MAPNHCYTALDIRDLWFAAADEIMHLELTDLQDNVLGLVAAARSAGLDAPALTRLNGLLLDAEMDDYYADANADLTCLFA